MIELASEELAGVTVVRAAGRLDALVSPELDSALRQALDGGQVRLLMDLGNVTYISSSCLRVLLLGARRARDAGGDLKLCSLSPRVREVFELAGFDRVLALCASQDQGLAAFWAIPDGPQARCEEA